MRMYIQKRLFSSLMLLLLASFLIYTILYTIPGTSTDVLLGDSITISDNGDKPGLFISYFGFLNDILHGNFGSSSITGESVINIIASHFYPTFSLTIFSFSILIVLFIPIAIWCGKYNIKKCDIYISLSMALPSFLLSFILVVIFALYIPILPLAGYKSIYNGVGIHLRYLILPSITLAITYSGLLLSIVFKKVHSLTFESPYLYAKARGLRERTIDVKYLFLPTLSVILSVLSQAFISLLSGVAVVETIFNIPGLGALLVTSVKRRDTATATTLVLFITLICIIVNLVTDIAIKHIDNIKGGYENA